MKKIIIPSSEKEQHFLTDISVLKKEIEISNLTKKDRVIEIGSGNGILTKELAKRAGKVLSFEIDSGFEYYLKNLVRKNKNLKIIYGNALDYDWEGYNKIVSNIPYSLSESVIQKAIKSDIKDITLIVGKNFKDILLSQKNKIGVISGLFFEVKPVMSVKKTSFNPHPRVESWLIRLTKKKESDKTEIIIREIVSKNGKIKNAIIYSLVESGKTKKQSKKIINDMNINKNVLEKPVSKITGKFILILKQRMEKLNV
ncbi:MAG: rRNA adenine N-6-methyltransferase family protein [Nanoarchaeota archaeon]